MGRACSTNGGEERSIQVLVWKPEGRRLLGRPRHIWEYNIKMNLPEMESGKWTGSIWLSITNGGFL